MALVIMLLHWSFIRAFVALLYRQGYNEVECKPHMKEDFFPCSELVILCKTCLSCETNYECKWVQHSWRALWHFIAPLLLLGRFLFPSWWWVCSLLKWPGRWLKTCLKLYWLIWNCFGVPLLKLIQTTLWILMCTKFMEINLHTCLACVCIPTDI